VTPFKCANLSTLLRSFRCETVQKVAETFQYLQAQREIPGDNPPFCPSEQCNLSCKDDIKISFRSFFFNALARDSRVPKYDKILLALAAFLTGYERKNPQRYLQKFDPNLISQNTFLENVSSCFFAREF